jgi:hypothetical protein
MQPMALARNVWLRRQGMAHVTMTENGQVVYRTKLLYDEAQERRFAGCLATNALRPGHTANHPEPALAAEAFDRHGRRAHHITFLLTDIEGSTAAGKRVGNPCDVLLPSKRPWSCSLRGRFCCAGQQRQETRILPTDNLLNRYYDYYDTAGICRLSLCVRSCCCPAGAAHALGTPQSRR